MPVGSYRLVNNREYSTTVHFAWLGGVLPDGAPFRLDMIAHGDFSLAFGPGTGATATLDQGHFEANVGALVMGDQAGAAEPGTYAISDSANVVGAASTYEGRRLRIPGTAPVYLVLDGVRRHVPDPETYHNLFDSWDAVLDTHETTGVPEGPALSSGASLVRPRTAGINLGGGGPSPEVYLSSNGVLRWITTPDAFNRYGFSWGRVRDYYGAFTRGPNIG